MENCIPIKTGDRCTVNDNRHRADMICRVMAVAEGYAMVRYPRASPFVASVKELDKVE